MNVRNDVVINSPNNKNETCTEFVIDDITKPFMLNGTTEVGEDYTFSAWVKSSEESSINIYGKSIPITTEWKRKRVTFAATGLGIRIYFDKVGTYYFYKSQLELGKVMSDASPSPEDIKASLEVKINRENLISEINASADIIRLKSNRLVVESDNLQILEDGTINATNGTFTGKIKTSEGEIADFDIGEDGLTYGSIDSGVYTKIGGDGIRWISGIEEQIYNEIADRIESRFENRVFQFYQAFKEAGTEGFELTPVGGLDTNGMYTGESYADWVNSPSDYIVRWDGKAKFTELSVAGARPYWRKGDTLSYNLRTAGFVTNGGKEVHFTVPLNRMVLGSGLTVTAASTSGFILRQDAKYTHGSASSTYAKPTKYSATIYTNYIYVVATFSSTTNVINNAPCGIVWSGTITIS